MSNTTLDKDVRTKLLILAMALGKVRTELVAMHNRMAALVAAAKEALQADDLEAYDAAHDELLPLRIEMAAQYGRLNSLLKQKRQIHSRVIDVALLAIGEEVGT